MQETFNLINYLKIIDVSLLNLFDYIDINNDNYLVKDDNRFILNFNAKVKDILESCIINNINDRSYFGSTNILVDTCIPKNNWHCLDQFKTNNSIKYILNDDSIYIDKIKLNTFLDGVFKKLNDNAIKNTSSKMKKIYFINFKSIDIFDAFSMISNLLSTFGNLNKDNFNYNIIRDGNHVFMHGGKFVDELIDNVRLGLINKGII